MVQLGQTKTSQESNRAKGTTERSRASYARIWIFVCVACTILLALYAALAAPKLYLVLDVSSSVDSSAQLFYDLGRGFNEHDSQATSVHSIAASNFPNDFESLAFPLPSSSVPAVRFDPFATSGLVAVRNVTIVGRYGVLATVPVSTIVPLNQLQKQSTNAGTVVFATTPNANDPILWFALPDIKQKARIERLRLFAIDESILLGLLVLSFALRNRFRDLASRVFQGIRKLDYLLAGLAKRLSDAQLIQFDRYALWFYLLCFVAFAASVCADLNGSSISMYSATLGNGAPEHPWVGAPRITRSDEWAYATPDILHHALRNDRFAVEQTARGGHSISLLDSVPVRHVSTLFRPQFWAFFILPVDYAFSYYWQFKALILVAGVFTWLLLLTRSTFWSVCGSLWFFFSASTQWSYSWSTGLPEMIGSICLAMVSACYLTVSRNRIVLAIAAIVAASTLIDFALAAYVPHLLPLCWVAIFFFLGWCIFARKSIFSTERAGSRILALLLVLVAVGGIGLLTLSQTREAIAGIANTDYPGRRVFHGRNTGLQTLTAQFVQWSETETHLPPALVNISEASGFLWLAPVTLFCMGRLQLSKFQKFALLGLWCSFLLILGWLLEPVPSGIAALLGLNRTGAARCTPALGLANVAIVALCMSAMRSGKRQFEPGSFAKVAVRILGVTFLVWLTLELTNQAFGNYFSLKELWFAIALTTALVLLLLNGRSRVLGIALVAVNAIAFGTVNPIERGLNVITGSQFYKLVRSHHDLLNGKWMVFSDEFPRSGFVEAAGCDTYTGMRFLPDIDHLKLLASHGLDARTFNNGTYLIAHQIPPNEKSRFEAVTAAITRWHVNPSDPLLQQLGIRYFAFDKKPSPEMTANLVPISDKPVDNMWLYRMK